MSKNKLNKSFKKRNMSIVLRVIVNSLLFTILLVVLHKGTECQNYLKYNANSLRQSIIQQNSKINNLNKRIDKLQLDLDNQKKEFEKLNKVVEDKLAFRDRISYAIQQSSSYIDKEEADNLAKAVDEVSVELNIKYGYPINIPKFLAVVSAESDFRNLDPNDAYAIGYAQVTPSCLEEVNKLAKWNYTMSDMYDMKSNLRVAWYMINYDRKKYGDNEAIVAYNQGYRHLVRSVDYCLTDRTSYLYKVNERTQKFKELLSIKEGEDKQC